MKVFAVLFVSLACFSSVILGQGFPNAVRLESYNRNGDAFCGGSIVANSYVLTAAHCVTGFGPVKVFGGYNGTLLGTAPSPVSIRNPIVDVSLVFMGFNLASLNINLSSLLLDDVNVGDVGTVSTVYPGYIESVNATVMDNTYCSQRIENYSSLMFCTDKCVNNPGASLQIGGRIAGIVISIGQPCRPGFPAAYARVTAFNSWLGERL